MSEPAVVGLIVGLCSIGVGLISIAVALFARIFKSPKEADSELSAAIDKLRTELAQQRRDHDGVARSNDVLANEVKHLGDSVKSLAEEVKGLRDDVWRPGAKPASKRGG